jgi:tellurite resistance protein TehA-like permease
MFKFSILKSAIQRLSPSYFALVMATGIVSTASHLQQYSAISNVLFLINNIAFILLLVLFVVRLLLFRTDLLADVSSHAKGAGFLTLVAGSCILGTSYAQAKGSYGPAAVLWYFGLVMWLIIIFSFLSSVILKIEKPSPEEGLNGIWFLLVVSTQSLSILGGILAPHLALPQDVTVFISLFAFLLGVMLYLILVPLITYRLLFYPVTPKEVVPAYWINMGAAAITTLAGVMLSQSVRSNALFMDLYPFIRAIALLFWCTASFWIPIVFIMEIWRYAIKGSPLNYTPALWSMVFPLGMYSVCTWRLAETIGLPFLQSLSKGFLYIAWFAWLATYIGLLLHLVKTLRQPSNENELVHST